MSPSTWHLGPTDGMGLGCSCGPWVIAVPSATGLPGCVLSGACCCLGALPVMPYSPLLLRLLL